MKSEILLTLIKEVVKNEVKQQVKEEITKLVKNGAITLNSQNKKTVPSLREMTEPKQMVKTQKMVTNQPQTQKEFTKNPVLNEILNMTTPFTSAQRAESSVPGVGGGSVLDMVQPERYEEDGWSTMDYRTTNVPEQQLQSTGNADLDAVTKALTRDYSELVKRFK